MPSYQSRNPCRSWVWLGARTVETTLVSVVRSGLDLVELGAAVDAQEIHQIQIGADEYHWYPRVRVEVLHHHPVGPNRNVVDIFGFPVVAHAVQRRVTTAL